METLNFLAQVVADISVRGFISGKEAKDSGAQSTGDFAFWAVNLNEADYSEDHEKVASEALAWIRDYKGDNAFMQSLVKVAAFDTIHMGQCDRAAWIIQKFLNRENEELPVEYGANSQFVGVPKQEVVFRGTVALVRTYRSRFGEKQVLSLLDTKGNVYTYFPSNKILPLEQGQTVRVRAIVKAHNVYNGVNQTIVTRATIVPYTA